MKKNERNADLTTELPKPGILFTDIIHWFASGQSFLSAYISYTVIVQKTKSGHQHS
jgi:hypothetical protein